MNAICTRVATLMLVLGAFVGTPAPATADKTTPQPTAAAYWDACLAQGMEVSGTVRFAGILTNRPVRLDLRLQWNPPTQALAIKWGVADQLTVRRLPGETALRFTLLYGGRPMFPATLTLLPNGSIRIDYKNLIAEEQGGTWEYRPWTRRPTDSAPGCRGTFPGGVPR